jgi:hypothetical protein
MLTPTPSPTPPARPLTLAEAVARARWPRNHATAQLEPHREELLRLRQGRASIESLVGGLRLLGVEVGRETIRLWLNRELGLKPMKRRVRRVKPVASDPTKASPGGGGTGTPGQSVPISDTAVAGASETRLSVADTPVPQGTSLIRPGETPLQAMHRRLAALDAEMAAAKAAGLEQPGSRSVRDNG